LKQRYEYHYRDHLIVAPWLPDITASTPLHVLGHVVNTVGPLVAIAAYLLRQDRDFTLGRVAKRHQADSELHTYLSGFSDADIGIVRDNARQLKFKAESTGFE
jgi:hypothetical protein